MDRDWLLRSLHSLRLTPFPSHSPRGPEQSITTRKKLINQLFFVLAYRHSNKFVSGTQKQKVSITRHLLARLSFVVDRGFEPLCHAWEACILALRWIHHYAFAGANICTFFLLCKYFFPKKTFLYLAPSPWKGVIYCVIAHYIKYAKFCRMIIFLPNLRQLLCKLKIPLPQTKEVKVTNYNLKGQKSYLLVYIEKKKMYLC